MNNTVPAKVRSFILQNISASEQDQICDQFNKSLDPNHQVLWSGLPREVAQKWADEHGMQTLTTAMGPLMNENDPLCPKRRKPGDQWPKYIHGASAIFALHISRGDVVTVLTPPPPERFHPSGATSFQLIEEPIIRGEPGNPAVGRIEMAHPDVPQAPVTSYQFWPTDQCPEGICSTKRRTWRHTKPLSKVVSLGSTCDIWPSRGVTSADSIRREHSKERQLLSEEGKKKTCDIWPSKGVTSADSIRREHSKERQLLGEEGAKRRQLLKAKKRKEMKGLQKRQAAARKPLKKSQRGQALRIKERKEMKNLRSELDKQKAQFEKEECSKIAVLKKKQKREKGQFQMEAMSLEKCQKRQREEVDQMRISRPVDRESRNIPETLQRGTLWMVSVLLACLCAIVGEMLERA